jgi:hypothetical protein
MVVDREIQAVGYGQLAAAAERRLLWLREQLIERYGRISESKLMRKALGEPDQLERPQPKRPPPVPG